MAGDKERDGLMGEGRDLVDLVIAYAKQELLEPLKGLGRFIGFGLLSALATCIGILFSLIGLLRLLQAETGHTFAGNLSWLPYVIVVVAGLLVAAVAAWRITAGPGSKVTGSSTEGKK